MQVTTESPSSRLTTFHTLRFASAVTPHARGKSDATLQGRLAIRTKTRGLFTASMSQIFPSARSPCTRRNSVLRRYRLAAGFAQGVLADLARMSINGFSALERGHRRSPQSETPALLGDALAYQPSPVSPYASIARWWLER